MVQAKAFPAERDSVRHGYCYADVREHRVAEKSGFYPLNPCFRSVSRALWFRTKTAVGLAARGNVQQSLGGLPFQNPTGVRLRDEELFAGGSEELIVRAGPNHGGSPFGARFQPRARKRSV